MSPIKAENRSRYPVNWTQIRARILKRARNRCEFCRVKNYAVGFRDESGRFWECNELAARMYCAAGRCLVRIILTIAHLDQMPENNRPGNLRALCQRCHLAHDRQHNVAKARATRERKSGQITLF